MSDLVLSVTMLAIVAMLGGAVLAFRKGDRKRAGLMIVLAIVLALNVAIWTVPTPSGSALADAVPAGAAGE